MPPQMPVTLMTSPSLASPPLLGPFMPSGTPGELLGLCCRCRRWRRVPEGVTTCPVCTESGPEGAQR
jgi:hypothetical protein